MGIFTPTKKKAIGVSTAVALSVSALIVPWEGLVLKAHWDPFGKVWDYCHGETQNVDPTRTYTPQECKALLMQRVPQYEASVKACLPVYPKLPLEVQASIVSLSYNVGTGSLCKSTMFRKLSAGDLVGACNEFPKWDRSGKPAKVVKGLTNRRKAEQAFCMKGANK